jgi:hypothetical protein
LRPLFDGFTGLHGLIDAILDGSMGEASTDDPVRPRLGHLYLDFHLIVGDPNAPDANDLLAGLTSGDHVAAPDSWEEHLVTLCGDGLQSYERFSCDAPDDWDRTRLGSLRQSLPEGFVLERITHDSVSQFAALADSLVYNFSSTQDFLTRGVGFGIRQTGKEAFVAGCSSFAISPRSLEFEIQTHPDFQRRGFALVTGSRMIEHCLENQLEPCWDAAHEGSALLAERLGFGNRRAYTAYRLE